MAARGRVRAAIEASDWDAALVEAEAARAISDTVNQPFERARLLLLLGMALGGRRRGDDLDLARDVLAEALDIFEGLDATPFVDPTRAQLARLNAELAALPS